MKRKQRREIKKGPSIQLPNPAERDESTPGLPGCPGEQSRYFTVIDIALMALGTVIICGQMVPVPPIDYEDPLYLVHSPYVHVSAAFRDALKLARQADPSSSDSEPLESEIESIEHYLSVRLATQ